jgi:sulfide dehydrogenase cytochrome subunit
MRSLRIARIGTGDLSPIHGNGKVAILSLLRRGCADTSITLPAGYPLLAGQALLAGCAFLACCCLMSAPRAASPNGSRLADACTSCHGIDGHSSNHIPPIAGLARTTLVEQLKSFRAQTRDATIMNRIARGYDDAEIEALADYFSSAVRP